MKILIVDDEIDEIESLTRGLRGRGYQVSYALNGQEALNYIHNESLDIDLVITDYAMPIMNGIELLQDIRKSYGHLPVIMMTAYGKKDLIIDALRNRCDSFIEKPFTLDQLLLEVERAEMYILENMSLHQISESIPKFLHQINNPLTCIYGSVEIALNRLNDTETIKKCIKRIIASVESIVRINGEILKNARPDKAIREAVEIKSLINDSLVMFEDVMTLKGVSVCNSLSGPPLYVFGHKFDLEQLFRNLIVNAIDAMDGKAQKLLAFQAEANEDYCSISVVDTGCGIPDDAIDMIFTPYFTLKKNGTGLGLAVVKKVVEEHSGKMTVTSLEGKTTAFTITLPLVDPLQTEKPTLS